MAASRIRTIRWRRVAVPFRATLHNSQASYRVREGVLIEVVDADGVTGIGEASLPAGSSFAANGAEIDEHLDACAQPFADFGDKEPWRASPILATGHGRWPMAIHSGFETAIADLASRQAGRPLYRWLGRQMSIPAPESPVVIETNGLVDLVEPPSAANSASVLVADGFRVLKLKVGGDPLASIVTVAAVRAAVGDDIELRCDANQSWGMEDARTFLDGAANYGVALCEEPLAEPGADFRALAMLRQRSGVSIAVDESVRTHSELANALTVGAADALVVKPMFSGIRESCFLIDAARKAGLPTVVTTTFDLAPGTAMAMHVAALVGEPRPACGLATSDLVVDSLGTGVPAVVGGRVQLSNAPGLGVELDYAAVERFAAGPWVEVSV